MVGDGIEVQEINDNDDGNHNDNDDENDDQMYENENENEQLDGGNVNTGGGVTTIKTIAFFQKILFEMPTHQK